MANFAAPEQYSAVQREREREIHYVHSAFKPVWLMRERERERGRFTTPIQPAWLMRTGLCSCLSLLQQGNETMADILLVLVPHEHTHAPRSILEQARKLDLDVTELRAIKHTMELIAHGLCTANGAPAKVARAGWPGKTALLNGQSTVAYGGRSCSV